MYDILFCLWRTNSPKSMRERGIEWVDWTADRAEIAPNMTNFTEYSRITAASEARCNKPANEEKKVSWSIV